MKNKSINPIAVVGGGHAAVEAALAISRVGLKCNLIVLDPNSIGRMSCNPAIGGLAKGHIVKEIDAFGGIMGRASDVCGIQFKTLNTSKGRAVWSPRAQIDKLKYQSYIQRILYCDNNINIIQDEVVDIVVNNGKISGVKLSKGHKLLCSAVVVCAGTFLNGLIHIGIDTYPAGRVGEKPTNSLANNLADVGFERKRLKTGTPARALTESINFDLLEASYGDALPTPFSMMTPRPFIPLDKPCHLAYTNTLVHKQIDSNIHKSAMYSGKIKGVGPRYCPSIEDKIVRFPQRDRHQIFVEPEWTDSNQVYLNGFSTSLPETVQIEALRKIDAFENLKLVRPGYAIEYDYFPSRQLKNTLETKLISGLYMAGQINGTSGYEEAAAQGLLAGANAALKTCNQDKLVFTRDSSYIGVLIDDIITKHIDEPYRMFTSRAEHRLYLRPDNAHRRLSQSAINLGLLSRKQAKLFLSDEKNYTTLFSEIENEKIKDSEKTISALEFIKRPNVGILEHKKLARLAESFDENIVFQVETEIKYAGYVNIERNRIKKQQKIEHQTIPNSLDYSQIEGLSSECIEKLSLVQPETLGQASRVGGIRPSDIVIITIYLERKSTVSRETH